jgi:hypothetical protein
VGDDPKEATGFVILYLCNNNDRNDIFWDRRSVQYLSGLALGLQALQDQALYGHCSYKANIFVVLLRSMQYSVFGTFFTLHIFISPWMDAHQIRRICDFSLTSLSSFWSALSLKLMSIIHLVGCLISGLILHMIMGTPRQLHCQTSRVRASYVCYHLREHCHPSVAQSDTTF